MENYIGTIISPQEDGTFRQIDKGEITVDDEGKIVEVKSGNDSHEGNLSPYNNVIIPGLVNCHNHAFQPPGVPGELIVFEDGVFSGWLPETLRIGELRAKEDPSIARSMVSAQMQTFVQNGVIGLLQYATSSEDTVRVIIEEANKLGIQVRVGFVAMDQGINPFVQGLQTSGEEAIRSTENLLREFGNKIVVIDRFPIAVSSATRVKLAELAREYNVLFETHVDESKGERDIVNKIYPGGRSIIQILADDGVFEPGTKVGLAHGIHTTDRDFDLIAGKIAEGAEVYLRACPNSNDHLGSQWVLNPNSAIRTFVKEIAESRGFASFAPMISGKISRWAMQGAKAHYVEFPWKKWMEAGALITLGTDQGAGRNQGIFPEMLDEKRRHMQGARPTEMQLLQFATMNGARSLGFEDQMYMKPGTNANFIVVQMAGSSSHYADGYHFGNIEATLARVMEGGVNANNISTVYSDGRKVK